MWYCLFSELDILLKAMIDSIILLLLVIIFLLTRVIVLTVDRRRKLERNVKYYQIGLNSGLEFSFPYSHALISRTQAEEIRKILKWPKGVRFYFGDVLSLLPTTLTPPEKFCEEIDKDDFKPREYTLTFDSHLRPYYTLTGWEGVEDTLPYSEYGDNEWFKNEGWKSTRPKTPENIGDCYVSLVKFLVENKFVKV